ncbi:MAG TPA: hypothetical protein VN442_17515 [Bryobacteraceae bacterium]|nr:hypothetical protein [Bryobacteraceae bacterium]
MQLSAFVASESAEAILAAMRLTPGGRDAAIIGRAVADHPRMALLRNNCPVSADVRCGTLAG